MTFAIWLLVDCEGLEVSAGLPRVVFRCDASPVIGAGHIVRCMALAGAFRTAGAKVRFCVADATLATVPELAKEFPGCLEGFSTSLSDLDRMADAFSPDIIVIDHYLLGLEYERGARQLAGVVVRISDMPDRQFAVTHLVDTTLGRKKGNYADLTSRETVLMCGSEFALLREPFRILRPERARTTWSKPFRLLITVGMTDPFNVASMALQALAGVRCEFEVAVVLSRTARHLEQVVALVRAGGAGWRLLYDLDAMEMAELTLWADLIVGAPGSASYERCCLGKSSLLVQVADNQAPNAAALAAAGAAVVVGSVPDVTVADMAGAIDRLMSSTEALKRLALAAFDVADGAGAERVAAKVLEGWAGMRHETLASDCRDA